MPFFDKFFQLSPTSFGTKLQDEKIQKVLTRLFQQNSQIKSILEIGPGWGELAAACANLSLSYYAVEINHKMASNLSRRGYDIAMTNVPPLPFVSDNFDAVVALNVLEHMPDLPRAFDFVGEMVRVVRSGGLVCINCPDFLATGYLFWDADYTHNFPTTKNRLNQLLSDHKLNIVDDTYFSGPISGELATPLSWMAKIFPETIFTKFLGRWFNHDRIRRARLTFLRNIFVIGRKVEID